MLLVAERRTSEPTSPQQEAISTPTSLQEAISTSTTNPTARSAPTAEIASWKAGAFAVINVLALVLAARLIVLIGVCGGIFLTYLALDHPDWFRISTLSVYCVGVIFPAVWLAISGRA
jgi:hypothetical protein